MMDLSYLLTPFLAWLMAGVSKFLINSYLFKRFAFDLIGYGGLPSNHTSIVTSIMFLILLKQGVDSPAFGVAITLAFIVILDANSLRRNIGKHAVELNKLIIRNGGKAMLRERMGHSKLEILAGIIVGGGIALLVHYAGDFLSLS